MAPQPGPKVMTPYTPIPIDDKEGFSLAAASKDGTSQWRSSSRAKGVVVVLVLVLFLTFGAIFVWYTYTSHRSLQMAHDLLSSEDAATSGSLFLLPRVREIDPSWLQSRLIDLSQHHQSAELFTSRPFVSKNGFVDSSCTGGGGYQPRKYAVVTTIAAEPTEAMLQLALSSEWCVVIIGDHKSPSSFSQKIEQLRDSTLASESNAGHHLQFLNLTIQAELPFSIIALTPINSFARKNIGFAVAISANASVIYDFDDDNLFITESLPTTHSSERKSPPVLNESLHDFIQPPAQQMMHVRSIPVFEIDNVQFSIPTEGNKSFLFSSSSLVDDVTVPRAYNPYPHFGLVNAWPRGFPLQAVTASLEAFKASPPMIEERNFRTCIPVVQQLFQGRDPD